jgi:hypothetical protein
MRLNLAIGLPLRNQDELDSLLTQISDPASPNYRHYLTTAQFAARFGPTEQDYETLIHFVQENGLVVTGTHSNRVLLDVSGEVPDIEKVFHIKMMAYKHDVRGEFYAPDREPSLDLEIKTLHIGGLDNFDVPHPMSLKTVPLSEMDPYVTGSGPGGYFIGKDFRAAYASGVTLTGSGQVVGLLEFDGFYASDEQKNAAQAGLPVVPTQTVLLDGFSGAAGNANIEVILDIMMASYMAPGLSKVIVYEGSYPNDILNRMATDNLAQQLSSSWGFGINATTEQIFKQYIAQGQSFLQASGDSGAYTNGVMPPSDDPSLTVVGGTSLTTSGAGGPWQSESAWSGSGGGISTTYPIPSYQQGFNLAASGGSSTMRNIPDVALTADVQMYLIANNGQAVVVGGTSAATPLWAGFVALANQQAAVNAKPRVGFLNPLLYAIGNSSNYAVDMNDITQGNNGFSAVTGYDLATGWGSPAGQHLINDLTEISSETSFVLSSSVSALSIMEMSTGGATLTVTPKNGFNGSVSLAVTGLPSGVTAAFSPASTTGTSTVTFTVSASAAAGTYPLTITGVSGSLSSSITVELTVVIPSFSLSSSASTLKVSEGASGSSTIGVSGKNGFSGSVSLAATGLPSGATAIFSPTSTTSTSVVTFTVGACVPGIYPLTITGNSGTLNSSTMVKLTVSAPAITSLSPATAVAGGSAITLTVTGTNFVSGSTVMWGSTALTTTYGSATSLKAAVTSAQLAAAGSVSVTVKNTGTVSSAASSFKVNGPAITSLSPTSVGVGSPDTTITVTGTNFIAGTGSGSTFKAGSLVYQGSTALTVIAGTASSITATIPKASLATADSLNLTVQNPGGATSTASKLIVSAPAITSLSPATAVAGGSAITLTVTGTNFVSGSTVMWGSAALTTTYGNASSLKAAVTSAQLAAAGSVSVTVKNTSTVSSAASSFKVNGPAITLVSPTSVGVGSPDTTITVTGTNFIAGTGSGSTFKAGSLVYQGSTALTVIAGTASSITATIPKASLATAGSLNLTVQNPGGATSTASKLIVATPTIASLSLAPRT